VGIELDGKLAAPPARSRLLADRPAQTEDRRARPLQSSGIAEPERHLTRSGVRRD